MTESRVSQLHTKAILRLKGKLQGSLERASADRHRYRRSGCQSGRPRGCGNLNPSTDDDLQLEECMPNTESGKIRNVAVIGHRGTGKTSLVEALLYESGTTNRLGSVADKSTCPTTTTRSAGAACRSRRPSPTSSGRTATST